MESSPWIQMFVVAVFLTQGAEPRRCRRGSGNQVQLPDEQRLLRKLFKVYTSDVRPVYNSSHNVQVIFNFNLIQIMDMDEKNQILTLNAWLESEWRDELIRWDPEDYGGLIVFRLPSKKLWLPDIVLYNNADDYTSGFMPCNAMVHSDGKVTWSPPARLRSSCKMDITYFPFDVQKCHLKFGSWAYDKAQVDLINRSSLVDVHSYVANGEWRLTRYEVIRHEVVYPISDAVYPDVTIYLVIHRRILYYVLNILLPCFWLNILSVLTFCLPPDAGEKITLSITVLLSYSVFMLLIADSMPPTSDYVPLIEIYLTLSMAVASIAVIVSVLVMKLHHCPPSQTPVPQWVKVVILGYVSKFVRCRCFISKRKRKQAYCSGITPVKYGDQEEIRPCLAKDGRHVSRSSHVCENRADVDYRSGRRSMSNRGSSPDSHVSLYERTSRGMEELLKYLKLIVDTTEEEDRESEMHDEWKQVALVVDRLMFWVFLAITVTFTLLVLVIIPGLNYADERT